MIISVYGVKDLVVNQFLSPFHMRTHEEAIRAFKHEATTNPNSNFKQHPNDFHLFHLGEFDSEHGVFIPLTTPPVLLARASEFVVN